MSAKTITLNDGLNSTYVGQLNIARGPGAVRANITLTRTAGPGITLDNAVSCNGVPESYNTGRYIYSIRCATEVRYKGMDGFQQYNPENKLKRIEQINLQLTWWKDGTVIDPTVEYVPSELLGVVAAEIWYGGGKTNRTEFNLNQNEKGGYTEMIFNMPRAIKTRNPNLKIEYDWSLKQWDDSMFSPFYYRMAIEQLDGNIELTYLPGDGSSAVKLAPNTELTILHEQINQPRNGVLNFKMSSPRDFGTRSTRLKVTVECQ
ncbi:TPA: hypothetical protein ACHTGG_001190 [Escherichia coli]